MVHQEFQSFGDIKLDSSDPTDTFQQMKSSFSTRAGHAHLVSKAGSLISGKAPSPVSNGVAFNTQSRKITDKLHNIRVHIEGE